MTSLPYGSWPSPIDARLAAAGERRYGELRAAGDALYWLESRPDEGGRTTLLRWRDGSTEELIQAPYNARSRVHEYGGGAWCPADADGAAQTAFFVNFADQNIYSLGGGEPAAVTTGDSSERFGDLAWDGTGLVAVRESHPAPEASADGDSPAEPRNELVRIDVDTGAITVLHSGRDFYASPALSAGGRIAFIAWDHPNMPWDGTELIAADYGTDGLSEVTVIAGGASESIVQPEWDGDTLVFASDASGYWNLYAWDDSGIECLLRDEAEYAGPLWALGTRWYTVAAPGIVIARRVDNGEESLVALNRNQGFASPIDAPYAAYGSLCRTPAGLACIGGRPDAPAEIGVIDLANGTASRVAGDDLPIPRDVVSAPERIEFPSTLGNCHAFFHPPANGDLTGERGELPPLLVLTHGGPTSSASGNLSLRTQFYTSRGWAVANVDYGGSTGYGRAYRERLDGAWGTVDVDDCVACVRYLAAQGRIDPARAAIRGGSAGGYTTLAALAFADTFRAGASHYGVGDLRALAADTHKFESRYVDRLVAPDDMERRSPIRHADDIDCPVIFFQGTEDRVVPPNQTEAMRAALAARGIPVACLMFEGEGHGFRRAENVVRAIEAEYAFFARVFGHDAPGIDAEVAIENLPGEKAP